MFFPCQIHKQVTYGAEYIWESCVSRMSSGLQSRLIPGSWMRRVTLGSVLLFPSVFKNTAGLRWGPMPLLVLFQLRVLKILPGDCNDLEMA